MGVPFHNFRSVAECYQISKDVLLIVLILAVVIALIMYRSVVEKQMYLSDVRTWVVNAKELKTCFNIMSETNIIHLTIDWFC